VQLHRHITWERGWGTDLAGLAPSRQTARSLMRTLRLAKAARKKLAKSEFGNFTLMGKYTQLLLIECI